MNERNKQKWKNLTNSRVGLRNKIGHPAHRHKGADSCVEYPRNIHKVLTRDTEYRIALNNGFSESSGSKRESFREIKRARKPEMILYSTAKASQLCTKPSQLCTTPSQLYNTAKPSQLYNTAKPNQLYNTANTSQPRPNMAEFMHRHTARGEKWRERERGGLQNTIRQYACDLINCFWICTESVVKNIIENIPSGYKSWNVNTMICSLLAVLIWLR